jgi:2-polyprenyl-3-methyl-5-hydroxy-6-metoxy-1,4-benzoquinol methylase
VRLTTDCLLCGTTALTLPFPRQHPWLAQCPRCAFLFSTQRPSEQELADYYSRYPVQDHVSAITLRRFDEFLDACEPFRRSARLLDYGAGDGFFAERARLHGWDAIVTEMSTVKTRTCEAKGLPVLEADQFSGQAATFDVVIAHEVLEHVSEPAMLLDTLAALLREGGLLYLTTPNIDGLSRRTLGGDWRIIEYPEHLNYFSVGTIRRLFADQRLSIRRVATTGVDAAALSKWRGALTRRTAEASKDGELLRESWEQGSRVRLKGVINATLSFLGLGDTIKVWAVRESGSSLGRSSTNARARGAA